MHNFGIDILQFVGSCSKKLAQWTPHLLFKHVKLTAYLRYEKTFSIIITTKKPGSKDRVTTKQFKTEGTSKEVILPGISTQRRNCIGPHLVHFTE